MEMLIILLMMIVIGFLIQVAILRWVFRVNEIVNALNKIVKLLEKRNLM